MPEPVQRRKMWDTHANGRSLTAWKSCADGPVSVLIVRDEDALVEKLAEAMWNEREYRDPSGPRVDRQHPDENYHEPDLWESVINEGRYPASVRDERAAARLVAEMAGLLAPATQSSEKAQS